jgi:hypothetical protein
VRRVKKRITLKIALDSRCHTALSTLDQPHNRQQQACPDEGVDYCANEAAGLDTHLCNHTWRGSGITAYLENGGTLENAKVMAAHAPVRTTQLYDRRRDDVTLDEVVKINIRG